MKSRSLVFLGLVLASCTAARAGPQLEARAPRPSPTLSPGPFEARPPNRRVCPNRVLRLTPDSTARATTAALTAAPRIYRDLDTRGTFVTEAIRARYDTER
jgi:hypothetical protein